MWNPHQQKYIDKIEMVQRRAARYTLNRNHISSVSSMLQELDWETTSCRRSRADLICFFKVQHKLIAVPSPSLIQRPNRQYSSSYYQIPYCSTESYRQSFFPHTVRLWNSLPPTVQSLDSLDAFKAAISKLRFKFNPTRFERLCIILNFECSRVLLRFRFKINHRICF